PRGILQRVQPACFGQSGSRQAQWRRWWNPGRRQPRRANDQRYSEPPDRRLRICELGQRRGLATAIGSGCRASDVLRKTICHWASSQFPYVISIPFLYGNWELAQWHMVFEVPFFQYSSSSSAVLLPAGGYL